MEFGQVQQIVQRQAEGHWDKLVTPMEMQFRNFDEIEISGELFDVSMSAKRLIGQRLGVPVPYIQRCAPELQERNLNYWLKELDQHNPLFCRFDDRQLRAMFTKRYALMDSCGKYHFFKASRFQKYFRSYGRG